MTNMSCRLLLRLLLPVLACSLHAQTDFTLNPLTPFGGNGDGSIRPGDQPWVSGPGTLPQPGDLPGATNGLNQRGISYDPVSRSLVYVDTRSGSGGSGTIVPNAGIYILDSTNGTVITTLNTNGIVGGAYTHVGAAVANDGAVYVCNQVTVSTNVATPFKIYRWNSVSSIDPPVVAFSGTLTPAQRYGESMDIRGAGAGTEIIIGAMPGTTATNVVLFTTADGTNYTANVIGCTNVTSANFNDGIAFGTNNTFWAKRIGAPLLYLSYDLAAGTARTLAVYNASNLPGFLNLGAIAVDNTSKLLAALEQVGGTVTAAPERLWLFDITDPLRPPVALSFRDYLPNNPNATAPHGYLDFGGGRLYANNVNNGLLASTVDLAATPLPIMLRDLAPTNRVAVGQTAHFEVQAYPHITGYQWRTNGVPVPGATNFFIDVPNVQTNDSGRVYSVVITNPAGSTNSANATLSVVNPADLFHLSLLWSYGPGVTNYISTGGPNVPNERSLAYHALSNQLLVVKRIGTAVNIFVIDPNTGQHLYSLNTNGLVLTNINIPLLYIAVADDGAVYACNGNTGVGSAANFRIYRWADTSTNSYPTNIWTGNPAPQVNSSDNFRWGDVMDVRGAGVNTQILLNNQDVGTFRFVSILRPGGADLNQTWTPKGYVLQNNLGGAGIGQSLQFGLGSTFWQKRYQVGGAPLVQSSFDLNEPDPALAPIVLSPSGQPLFTNGPVGINFTFNLAAAINFTAAPATAAATPDELILYDLANPSTPVVLNRYNFPINRVPNANAIAQVVFGTNATLATNYVFALDANNGIMGFTLSSGPLPPPLILAQPRNQRVVAGAGFSLGVVLDSRADVQWQKQSGAGFTNVPAALNPTATNTAYAVNSSAVSDSGNYRVIAANSSGAVTSIVASVLVSLPQDNYSLSPIWVAAPPGYVSSDGGPNTPRERAIAYNALSNQLLVVRCPVQGNPSTAVPEIHVVDANTGTELYTMDMTGVFPGTESEVAGSNPLNLCAIAAADDGNIYACNEVPNGGGGAVIPADSKLFRVYRWTNSAPTTPAVQIFAGDPAGQTTINLRWGDVMTVRGSGTNTEILFDDQAQGFFAGILRPTDATLNTFTNYPLTLTAGPGSIGRSIQFQTGTNFWQKRKGLALFLTGFNTAAQTTVQIANYNNFPLTLGGVAVDPVRNLAIGVDFTGNATSLPDALALYEITDPNAPMLISRYNFPITPQVGNVNFVCSTVIGGNKVFSLDGNNGIVAFTLVPPGSPRPSLNIARSGATVLLSWPTNQTGFTLQANPSVAAPTNWTNVSTGTIVGDQYIVTNALDTASFFRLIK